FLAAKEGCRACHHRHRGRGGERPEGFDGDGYRHGGAEAGGGRPCQDAEADDLFGKGRCCCHGRDPAEHGQLACWGGCETTFLAWEAALAFVSFLAEDSLIAQPLRAPVGFLLLHL